MADSPLIKRLRERASHLGSKAVSELLRDGDRGEALSTAMKVFQDGRRVYDEQGGRMVSALGFATTEDLTRVRQKLGKLRKKLDGLLAQLDDAGW